MELLEKFGFNPILFVAQVVNFLVLLYILKRFLFNPILKMLKSREQIIAKGIEEAEEARVKLEAAEKKKKEILKETQAEADKILEQARALGLEMRTQASEEARAEAEQIISEAKSQAEIEFEKMRRLAKGMSLEISQKILHSVIKTILTRDEQEKVLDKALKEFKKN